MKSLPRSRACARRRKAFTLVEMALNLVVLTLVMGTVSSAVFVASRAVPTATSPLQTAGSAFGTVEQLAAELFTATAFAEQTAHSVQFSVPDRDNDGQPETILYEWSGVAGDPLRRKYNTGLKIIVADDVHEFELAYATRSESETTQVVTRTPGSETLLATFDNWSGGLLPSLTNNSITSSSWQGERFTVSPPAGAVELTFTRASLYLGRQGAAATGDQYTFCIHGAGGTGLLADQPSSTPLGTPSSLASSAIAAAYQAKPITFNANVISADMSQTQYWIVAKGSGANAVYAQGRNALLAPLDNYLQRWTTNSGASWQPSVDLLNSRELRFSVWGFYSTESITDETIVTERLTGISVTLRLGPDVLETDKPSRRWTTSVQILNAPVSTPALEPELLELNPIF